MAHGMMNMRRHNQSTTLTQSGQSIRATINQHRHDRFFFTARRAHTYPAVSPA